MVKNLQPMPTALTTRRLRLEPWRDEDLDAYEELVHERDPRTAAAPRDGRLTRDELRTRMTRQQTAPTDTGIGMYVVRFADHFIGSCGFIANTDIAEPELGYELLRAHHGNGYATEAARATVEAAAATGRKRLWARVRTWNDPSTRVLAKLGFAPAQQITTDDFGELAWWTVEL